MISLNSPSSAPSTELGQLLAVIANPVATQAKLAELVDREAKAKDAESAVVAKLTELGDLTAWQQKLSAQEAALNTREADLVQLKRRLESKRDALAAILEWADREHCSILDDNRIDKMQKRLAAHTAA